MHCLQFGGCIVIGAARRIGQDVVGRFQQVEHLRIARCRIVGMKTSRKETIDTMDRVSIGIGADLQELVIIYSLGGCVLFSRHSFESHPAFPKCQNSL